MYNLHKLKVRTNDKKQDVVVSTKGIQDIVVSNCGKLRFSEIMTNCNTLVGRPGGLYGNSKTALLG